MTTDARDKVVEAAIVWARRKEALFRDQWKTSPMFEGSTRDLIEAVDNLTASQGVKPEDVPPGTQFRFAPDTDDEPPRPAEWVLRKFMGDTPDEPRVCAQHMTDGSVMFFESTDRIIPLQDNNP